MKRVFILLGISLAACGGRAALEAYEFGADSGGGNAEGGAGGSPTSAVVTSSSNVVTSSVMASSVTVTTTGGSSCDLQGDCDLCIECALDPGVGPCAMLADACLDSASCVAFIDCANASGCGTQPECFEGCSMENPEGAKQYFALYQCAICDQCTSDCQGIDMGLCDL